MAKTQRADRNQRRKTVYAVIHNRYGDPSLAQYISSRDWSDSRLYSELGIKIPKKQPELKELTKQRRSRGSRELQKYLLGRQVGLSVEQANALKGYAKERITESKKYYDQVERVNTIFDRKERYALWRKWSANDEKLMPPDIIKMARRINREAGLDDQDKYGYVVTYYWFVAGKEEQLITDTIVKPDKFDTNAVHYQKTEIVAL